MRNPHWVNPRFRRLLSSGPTVLFKALFGDSTGAALSLDPIIGTGSATYTRTGNQVFQDHDDIYRTASANEEARVGYRRVENLCTYSENINPTGTDWTVFRAAYTTTNTGVGPSGEDSYEFLFDNAVSPNLHRIYQTNKLPSSYQGGDFRIRTLLRVKPGDGTRDIYLGVGCSSTTDATIVSVGNTFTDISDLADIGTHSSPTNEFFIGGLPGGTSFSVQIIRVQVENVSGASNQNPGEYVATTTAAAAAYYSTANGNTVASNVVTEATGSALSTTLGVLGEPASTNSLLQSRDFSTTWSNWNTPGLTQDQTGIDGVANTAWTIEDNDGSNLESVYQTITVSADSNTHCGSVFVLKDTDETRFPGIEMRVDGTTFRHYVTLNTKTGASSTTSGFADGSHWVEDHGNWWRVCITLANDGTGVNAGLFLSPAAATVIGTQNTAATGTAVFDQAQLELNRSTPTSPIYTTTGTVTRSTTSTYPNYPVSSEDNFKKSAGVMLITFTPLLDQSNVVPGSNNQIVSPQSGTSFFAAYRTTANDIRAYDGTSTPTVSVTFNYSDIIDIAVRWNSSTSKTQVGRSVNGGAWSWGTESTYDGDWGVTTQLRMFNAVANSGCVKKFVIYDSDMTTSEIETAAAAL